MSHHIAILGAESSGKTTLTEQLAEYYGGDAVFEYAREYMTTNNISYDELVHIAHEQYRRENFIIMNSQAEYIFFDTELINLKIWFREVFNKIPDWLANIDLVSRYSYYLITENDLPWQEDPLRSYADIESRDQLKALYLSEVKQTGIPYSLISGKEEHRLNQAIKAIDQEVTK